MAQDYLLPLWDTEVPNHIMGKAEEKQERGEILWVTQVQNPTVEVYLPAPRQATGQAVLICPGGGYMGLAYDWEGGDIAKYLNAHGIAGIVLKYRLPSSTWNNTPHEAPLQDAQQAMRLIRKNANDWNIKEGQIGAMGFSAGGHLASTLGTHFLDDITRPDFMVLIYPVISMLDGVTHDGSREALIGKNPSEELSRRYSNEMSVTDQTPKTFMVHSTDDEAVPVSNTWRFQQAMLQAGVSCETHVYPYGGHGYSLAIGQGRLSEWPEHLISWLKELE